MDMTTIYLALNGAAILTVSLVAGLMLYRTIIKNGSEHSWHLLHAGGSGRGVMLLALAATVHLAKLPEWLISTAAWLIIFFAWTSTVAMTITAITGERGFGWFGPAANRLTYALYAVGTVTVFPGFFLLIYGFFNAL